MLGQHMHAITKPPARRHQTSNHVTHHTDPLPPTPSHNNNHTRRDDTQLALLTTTSRRRALPRGHDRTNPGSHCANTNLSPWSGESSRCAACAAHTKHAHAETQAACTATHSAADVRTITAVLYRCCVWQANSRRGEQRRAHHYTTQVCTRAGRHHSDRWRAHTHTLDALGRRVTAAHTLPGATRTRHVRHASAASKRGGGWLHTRTAAVSCRRA
jgi:hypothetical protein